VSVVGTIGTDRRPSTDDIPTVIYCNTDKCMASAGRGGISTMTTLLIFTSGYVHMDLQCVTPKKKDHVG
jgi:hypothetical protein